MVNLQTVTVYGRSAPKFLINPSVELPKKFGMSYPIGKAGSYFGKSLGKALIRNNILQLLFTNTGERVMLPQFGAGLKKFLFEPIGDGELEEMREIIESNITIFMPKVKLESLEVAGTLVTQNSLSSDPEAFPDLNDVFIKAFFSHKDLEDLIKIEGVL